MGTQQMMWIGWVVAVPLFLTALLLLLERLETWVVAPMDRAEQVRRLLVSERPADEVERVVAVMLAPAIDKPRPVPTDDRTPPKGAPSLTPS